jgi:hypothetical protein
VVLLVSFRIVKCRGKKVKKIGPKEDPCSPFYWFAREHAVRVGKSLDQPACSPPVSRELQRFWQRMNPAEQKSYVDKAERAKQTSMVSASKKLTGCVLRTECNRDGKGFFSFD